MLFQIYCILCNTDLNDSDRKKKRSIVFDNESTVYTYEQEGDQTSSIETDINSSNKIEVMKALKMSTAQDKIPTVKNQEHSKPVVETRDHLAKDRRVEIIPEKNLPLDTLLDKKIAEKPAEETKEENITDMETDKTNKLELNSVEVSRPKNLPVTENVKTMKGAAKPEKPLDKSMLDTKIEDVKHRNAEQSETISHGHSTNHTVTSMSYSFVSHGPSSKSSVSYELFKDIPKSLTEHEIMMTIKEYFIVIYELEHSLIKLIHGHYDFNSISLFPFKSSEITKYTEEVRKLYIQATGVMKRVEKDNQFNKIEKRWLMGKMTGLLEMCGSLDRMAGSIC